MKMKRIENGNEENEKRMQKAWTKISNFTIQTNIWTWEQLASGC